jgi:xylose isomerase
MPPPTPPPTAGTHRSDFTECFPGISKIEYKGVDSTDPLSFRYYNADEVIAGKTMKQWCRFSICYWHTFTGKGSDPFGVPTMTRAFDDESTSMANAKSRVKACFEFMQKLGIEYYTFHDRDVAPEGATLAESNKNLDEIVDCLEENMRRTGTKLLWSTQNLFTHKRYMNGGSTNPDLHAFAYACAAAKKVLEINKRLGGENVVYWGGREGYQSVLNTDVKKELDHLAAFFKMIVAYQEKIGDTAQLLIEPKPREPTKHQYDYDAQTVIGFLHTYGLADKFKLNIEPNHTTLAGHDYEHDVLVSSKFGFLGSIDANSGDPMLGWDTDCFPTDIKKTTLVMKVVMEQGGLAPGGLNFDCKVRRESTEARDLFIGHIGAMDNFARGLRNAAKILEEGLMPGMVKDRYSTFDSELGKKLEAGEATLEDFEKFVVENGEPEQKSGRQEEYEMLFNRYV